MIYTVSRKKETKTFFVLSPIKLGRCWRNLVYRFLNKFAAKRYKRFPPHLNNVSTLPCESWNAHCARATVELSQKETPEFILLQMWPLNLQIWIQLITACGKYCKRRCTLISSYQHHHWRMAAAIVTWSSLVHSVLSCRYFGSSRSVMRISYTFSCNIPTHRSQLDSNLVNLEAIVKVGSMPEFLSVTTQWQHVSDEHFKFHKVVQRHNSSEVENVYTILQHIYLGNSVPNFIRIAQVS